MRKESRVEERIGQERRGGERRGGEGRGGERDANLGRWGCSQPCVEWSIDIDDKNNQGEGVADPCLASCPNPSGSSKVKSSPSDR
eukprot:602779-Hanusia_phi.AAC.5